MLKKISEYIIFLHHMHIIIFNPDVEKPNAYLKFYSKNVWEKKENKIIRLDISIIFSLCFRY